VLNGRKGKGVPRDKKKAEDLAAASGQGQEQGGRKGERRATVHDWEKDNRCDERVTWEEEKKRRSMWYYLSYDVRMKNKEKSMSEKKKTEGCAD